MFRTDYQGSTYITILQDITDCFIVSKPVM
jgi:hypothetical protein